MRSNSTMLILAGLFATLPLFTSAHRPPVCYTHYGASLVDVPETIWLKETSSVQYTLQKTLTAAITIQPAPVVHVVTETTLVTVSQSSTPTDSITSVSTASTKSTAFVTTRATITTAVVTSTSTVSTTRTIEARDGCVGLAEQRDFLPRKRSLPTPTSGVRGSHDAHVSRSDVGRLSRRHVGLMLGTVYGEDSPRYIERIVCTVVYEWITTSTVVNFASQTLTKTMKPQTVTATEQSTGTTTTTILDSPFSTTIVSWTTETTTATRTRTAKVAATANATVEFNERVFAICQNPKNYVSAANGGHPVVNAAAKGPNVVSTTVNAKDKTDCCNLCAALDGSPSSSRLPVNLPPYAAPLPSSFSSGSSLAARSRHRRRSELHAHDNAGREGSGVGILTCLSFLYSISDGTCYLLHKKRGSTMCAPRRWFAEYVTSPEHEYLAEGAPVFTVGNGPCGRLRNGGDVEGLSEGMGEAGDADVGALAPYEDLVVEEEVVELDPGLEDEEQTTVVSELVELDPSFEGESSLALEEETTVISDVVELDPEFNGEPSVATSAEEKETTTVISEVVELDPSFEDGGPGKGDASGAFMSGDETVMEPGFLTDVDAGMELETDV